MERKVHYRVHKSPPYFKKVFTCFSTKMYKSVRSGFVGTAFCVCSSTEFLMHCKLESTGSHARTWRNNHMITPYYKLEYPDGNSIETFLWFF
jgi:hypothetical protein